MKRIAFYCLHYGKEYLAWSVRSVQEAVDAIVVVYSDRPSFGHATNMRCPETEDQLRSEVERFLKKPLYWLNGYWGSEGDHRNEVINFACRNGVSQILVVDSDEIWVPEAAQEALELASVRPERNVLVRFVHFWRSFKWVCKDPCMPVRVINVGGSPGTTWYLSPQSHPVLHFGYAQSESVIDYKQSIHGHKGEWRPGWFEHKFKTWKPGIGDVHPTNVDFWNPELTEYDLSGHLDALLSDHPYYGLELIE